MEEANNKCTTYVIKKSRHTSKGDNNTYYVPSTKNMKKFNQEEAYMSWKNHHNQEEEEEMAAFVDATTRRGGCAWPPRSYACSFCKREFKSAQALGGHMNVHRRDRALLKQLVIINNNPTTNPIISSHDHYYNSSNSSMVGQRNQSYVSSRFVKHASTCDDISTKYPQNRSKKLRKDKYGGERNEYDYLRHNKRCKKNVEETIIKHSNIKDEVGFRVPGILGLRATKSMDDDLDLELRLAL